MQLLDLQSEKILHVHIPSGVVTSTTVLVLSLRVVLAVFESVLAVVDVLDNVVVVSTGHLFPLQGSLMVRFPIHFPPWIALTFIDLVLVRVPAPHELEQPSMVHEFHSQSIGTGEQFLQECLQYFLMT